MSLSLSSSVLFCDSLRTTLCILTSLLRLTLSYSPAKSLLQYCPLLDHDLSDESPNMRGDSRHILHTLDFSCIPRTILRFPVVFCERYLFDVLCFSHTNFSYTRFVLLCFCKPWKYVGYKHQFLAKTFYSSNNERLNTE